MTRSRGHAFLISFATVCAILVGVGGCSPAWYRLDADNETYSILASKTNDLRWFVPRDNIQPDPQSRFADLFDPDRPPIPPDDPVAHNDMHYPGGMRGYRYWHCNGDAPWIENPDWAENLELSDDGSLHLTSERAVELGLLNSREYQLELEELYLVCLGLSLERFQFDLQWFLTNFTEFFHFGKSPNEVNSLSTTTSLGFRRAFASGGQLLADLTNSFVWQYAGADSLEVQSNLAVTFIQPLLRNAGRNVALESLTQSERNVIYAARDFARFRKKYYFDVVSGNGGFLSILLRVQNIRNLEANLESLQEDLRAHEALAEAGVISRIQVDQVFQSSQNGRLQLVRARNELQTALDAYKIRLGLPPTLPVTIDDSLLSPFEFSDPELTKIDDQLDRLLTRFRESDVVATVAELRSGFEELTRFDPTIQSFLEKIRTEAQSVKPELPENPTAEQKSAYDYRVATVEQAEDRLTELEIDFTKLKAAMNAGRAKIAAGKEAENSELLQKLIRQQLSIVSELYVIETRLRAYRVELQMIELTPEQAVEIALENRLDIMNQQARVVDNWRRIQVTANRLKADLDVNAGANLGLEAGASRPFDFSAAGSSYRAGVRFDSPLNRKAERNAYRAQLILYQRARRDFMATEDRAVQEVRRDMRDLATNRISFEIARQSLIAAARQVEMSRDQLLLPAPITDSSSTQDTLIALNSLLQAKNSMISIWVDYETTRVQLLLDTEALQPDPSREPSYEYFDHPDGDSPTEFVPPPVGAKIGAKINAKINDSEMVQP